MKTYNSEKKELFDWIMAQTEALDKQREKKYWIDGYYIGGQDCPEDAEEAACVREFNRRLLELKKKYGVE
ncbi:MAG: hypothetical protein E7425_10935 [Ruminococcaceae bacterium]|nr:hypothetical protein [Oscillospiraceae bacterium]